MLLLLVALKGVHPFPPLRCLALDHFAPLLHHVSIHDVRTCISLSVSPLHRSMAKFTRDVSQQYPVRYVLSQWGHFRACSPHHHHLARDPNGIQNEEPVVAEPCKGARVCSPQGLDEVAVPRDFRHRPREEHAAIEWRRRCRERLATYDGPDNDQAREDLDERGGQRRADKTYPLGSDSRGLQSKPLEHTGC